jgi:hypothetical protein
MDNITHDNLGVEDIEKVFETGKKVAAAIKKRVRARKATKASNKGDYWTLTSGMKKTIPIPTSVVQQTSGKGITNEAILNFPSQPKGTSIETIIKALQVASQLQTPSTPVTSKEVAAAAETAINKEASAAATNVKKYLPYILGAVVVGLIVYLISKK